ncbi:hypothetical protein EB093_03660 [bacterium]|nr:hypothetical protein [bacterium]
MTPPRPHVGIIGASSMGTPSLVATLRQTDHPVTLITRRPEKIRNQFPGIPVRRADMRHPESLIPALDGIDILHIDLSLDPITQPFHFIPERDGLAQIIEIIPHTSVKRIGYVTSLVHQVQDGGLGNWWVFKLKQATLRMLADSKIPTTIFKTSTLMETIDKGPFLRGNRLIVPDIQQRGTYFLSGRDLGRQISAAYLIENPASVEFTLQGPERLLPITAARKYAANRTDVALSPVRIPMWPIEIAGQFNRELRYMNQLLRAHSMFEEKFWAESTWATLGAPEITLAQYARMASSESELDGYH